MDTKHSTRRSLFYLAIGAFVLAVLSLWGADLDVPFGSIASVVTIVASLAGLGSLGTYLYSELRARGRQVNDLRANLLAQASDAAAQEERNRLARELHDSIKQQIFGISMSAAAAEQRWDIDPQGAREALRDVRHSAQEAMAEMNALLQQLSPAPLERVGLVQALRDQCDALGYRTGAEVEATFGPLPSPDRLPAGAQESLFRIAQEAFANVARHARAAYVRVYLGERESGDLLALEIEDDGQGFAADTDKSGMGLENIRQRVSALGGALTLDTAPGSGTMLTVTVPVSRPVLVQVPTPQNHALNKVFLVGLGGGLAVAAALFYPLYVLVPGGMVEGWWAGSGAVGLALEALAVLLAVATGLLAARWARVGTRQAGILYGALAGGVAGVGLFLGLGAATAGVTGSATLLRHGLVDAGGDASLVRLLSTSAIEITWWSHGTFWGMLLAGAGLGAVGGLLSPPAVQPDRPAGLRQAWVVILTAMGFASTLALGVAVFVLSQLEWFIRDALARFGVRPATPLPLEGMSFWLVGTPAVLYLISLAVLCVLLRIESRQEDFTRFDAARRTAGLGLVALCLPFGILVANPPSIRALPTLVVVVSTIVASLVLGALYLGIFLRVSRQGTAQRFDRRRLVQTLAAVAIVIGITLMSLGPRLVDVLGLPIGFAVVVVSAVLIVVLWRQPQQPALDKSTLAWLRAEAWRSRGASIGTALALVLPLLVALSATVSTVALPIGAMPALTGSTLAQEPAPSLTPAELVRGAYLTHARILVFALAGVVVAVGLSVLVLHGAAALVARRSDPHRQS